MPNVPLCQDLPAGRQGGIKGEFRADKSKIELCFVKLARLKEEPRFVIDFYCSELLLAVEIDGRYHKTRVNYDIERDKRLGWRNIVVIRYEDREVMNEIEKVKENLAERIRCRVQELVLSLSRERI